MKLSSTIASVLSVVAVMIGVYVVSVARQSADMLVVQATSGSSPPVRLIAETMLGRLEHCPNEDFHPTTPIGFIVAGWEQTGESERFLRVLDVLLTRGCEIDSYGARGLTPLHSAVLFNNSAAVVALLRRGANRELTTAIPNGVEDRNISLNALSFARYLDDISGEDRSAVIAALD